MKRILPILLALILLTGCSAEKPEQTTPTVPTPPVTTVPPETTVPGEIPVETPCGTLYLPDGWDIPITARSMLGDPMVISFLAEDVPLYDLIFSTISGPETVGIADGLFIGMRLHPLAEETDLLLSMQESVNQLLSQLAPEPVSDLIGESGAGEELLVLTPYGTLHFPFQWEECLLTRQTAEDTVEFCCLLPEREPVSLFTVSFGGEDGDIRASITAHDGTVTPVSVTVSEPEFDNSWTQGEMDLVHAMQEDMNYLLNALS